jgi:primosomal protein N' (replication factor Y) (superfamily II helicase)
LEEIFANVAVELPVEGIFSYSVPPALVGAAAVGKRALVSFGKRTVTAYIVGLTKTRPEVKGVKPLVDVLDSAPIFDEKRLKFYEWLSSYYFSTLGMALSLIQPAPASVKSRRTLSLTESGERSTGSATGISKEVLEAARSGVTVTTLVRRFKGKPIYSTIERLKAEGLIDETETMKGVAARLEKTAVITGKILEKPLGRSPAQERVLRFLSEKGETTVKALKDALGDVSQALKKLEEKGLVKINTKEALRSPLEGITPREAPFEPNEEQKAAIKEIMASLGKDSFSPFLLYGVTGSGKTLVYLKALEEALKTGKKAIILAPEIALTPWPAAYLVEKFPGRVAIAHSGLSDGERFDEWRRIARGEVDIVVGARSALFSPIKDLGLIIVDEEHETSYKQEEGVRYNARDAALMLGKYLGITVVLGSATPSVETFYNARTGKLAPLVLKQRVGKSELPEVEVLDLRGGKYAVLSDRLKGLISETLGSGQQTLLFLNRRGFSSTVICRDCGHSFPCLNCSVTLTMHKKSGVLKCHYCDLSVPLPDECPECKGVNLIQPGTGTERVEEEVKTLFPEARVRRMDRDTTAGKGSAKKIIDEVEEKKVDILIGTQMVSKGHHFPGISLVGVISGDTSLNIPDFRSSERTFQLITQAAGRAGRGEIPGKVVIQTLNPEQYAFKNAATHDYDGFYEEEIKIREEAFYPPFSRVCNLRVEGVKEDRVVTAALHLKKTAERLLGTKDRGINILGPAPALLSRLKGRHRWQMLVKGRELKHMHAFLKALKTDFEAKKFSAINLVMDMDPTTMI